MENKKPGKEKLIAWVGLALGALALFLVVYSQWLGPQLKVYRAEREVKKAAAAEQKKWDDREKEGKKEKKKRADWTLEDYDSMLKELVIDKANDSLAVSLGYTIDSEAEVASLRFDQVYITGDRWNREDNNGAFMVVVYTFQYDNNDYGSSFTIYYNMEEDQAQEYRYRDANTITAEGFADYWIEHQGELLRAEFTSLDTMYDEDKADELKRRGCMVRFYSSDFEALYGEAE